MKDISGKITENGYVKAIKGKVIAHSTPSAARVSPEKWLLITQIVYLK